MIRVEIIRMKVSKDKITTEIMKIDFEFQQEITKIRISIQTRLKGKNQTPIEILIGKATPTIRFAAEVKTTDKFFRRR